MRSRHTIASCRDHDNACYKAKSVSTSWNSSSSRLHRHHFDQPFFRFEYSLRFFHRLSNMPSFTYLTAALALTSAVAANPVQKRDAFSVEQVKHAVHLKNGPAQVAKTMRKFGKVVPAHIQAAADARANVSLHMRLVVFEHKHSHTSDRHCCCCSWL